MNNVLYFPYINVPESNWFVRMLLYWDEVATIIPSDFAKNPDLLEPYTRDLLRENLITQIFPGGYIMGIPNFDSAFINYILSLGEKNIKKRRKDYIYGHTYKVHMEKINSIYHFLNELKLANKADYPWYNVEAKTALDFMYYLASTLGKDSNLNFIPITNQKAKLNYVIPNSDIKTHSINIKKTRIKILNNLFPSPAEKISINTILDLKQKYNDELQTFRRYVEREVLTIVSLNDDELEKERLKIFYEEANDHIERIKSNFKRKKHFANNIG